MATQLSSSCCNIFGKFINKYLLYRNKQLNIFQVRNRNLHIAYALQKNVAFNLSDIGEGIREVVIKEWFVREGDEVKQFDNLCEVQSDKASVTITSRYDGKILKLHGKIDDVALVGKPLIDFDVSEDDGNNESVSDDQKNDQKPEKAEKQVGSEFSQDKTSATGPKETAISQSRNRILATPAVRRIANENKVNLQEVAATGKLGRVLKSDILEHLNLIPPTLASNKSTPVATEVEIIERNNQQTTQVITGDRVEKLKDVRKIMFKTMTQSLKIPHFVYSDEIDVTELIKLRDEFKANTLQFGVKLTFMPFFIKAASLALNKFPILNSALDESTESIIYKSSQNICVAMATPCGLVVPNIKDCQNKSIIDIAKELNFLQAKGKNGQLTPNDFANGTFSLSNIGVVGGTYTAPCITPPQVSIGAIGTTKCVPRFGPNDEIRKAHIVNVSWSADHRVIDGVTMAGFSNEWKKFVENPKHFILQ